MSGNDFSKELNALAKVLEALSQLDKQECAFVLDTVHARLGIPNSRGSSQQNTDGTMHTRQATQGGGGGGGRTPTPKEFLSQKKPANGVEQITCLAYYLSKYREMGAFKTVDITKLNSEAAGHKFSSASVFARNAVTQNGYLVPAGGGKKQITARGEAVVEALPDRAQVKKAIEEHFFKGRKKKKHSDKKA